VKYHNGAPGVKPARPARRPAGRNLAEPPGPVMAKRSGRRPGKSGTREAIAAAAAAQFAAQGYDRVSLRGIAREAGVDPALVSHYFGSKQELFVAVSGLPFDPDAVVEGIFAGEREEVGERLARFVVGLLENPEGRRRMTGIVRAAASEDAAATMVRELIGREVIGRLVERLDVDDAGLRAGLVGSQVVGLTMARYVVAIEPLTSAPAEQVVAAVAPNLQRYLAGELGS
jgi:AcrR family transcriptional regulator